MQNGTKVGELATRCGVSPDAIRFYEREGLLPAPRRTAPGHRIYDADAFTRLPFTRRAQGIGLTLQDIGEILLLRDGKHPQAVQRVTRRLRARAEAIDREIDKLRIDRRLLDKGIRLCDGSASSALSRLERLFVFGKR